MAAQLIHLSCQGRADRKDGFGTRTDLSPPRVNTCLHNPCVAVIGTVVRAHKAESCDSMPTFLYNTHTHTYTVACAGKEHMFVWCGCCWWWSWW